MRLLKKSQPQPEKDPEIKSGSDLAEQLRAAQAAAEAYIAGVALKEKAASPLQPLPWHEMSLRLRFGRSAVDCALKLLELAEKK
jgi:hypothetical protein